jgi:hypothetical protein
VFFLLGQRIEAQALLKDKSPSTSSSKKSPPTRITLGLEFDHRGKTDSGKILPINFRKVQFKKKQTNSYTHCNKQTEP